MVQQPSPLRAAIEEPYREYWAELGRFLHVFCEAEFVLVFTLQHYAGIANEVAGVMLGGTRADAAKDQLTRILEAKGELETKKALERPMAQFKTINTIRNHLIHWGARHDGADDLLVTNAERHHGPGKFKEFRISVSDLQAMTEDLYRITLWFNVVRRPPHSDEFFQPYLAAPWLYKPPQPNPRLKHQTAPPEPTK